MTDSPYIRPIGVIGPDATALPLARRLAEAKTRVLLYLTRGSAPREARTLIEVVATPTDIGYDSHIVLSTIEDSNELRALIVGSEDRAGLGVELSPGSQLVDFGVRPSRESLALLGLLGQRGIAVVDAAAIGGDANPTFLLGGYPDAVDAVAPLLEKIGRVERTGPLGSAHTAAALMGYMEAAQVVAEQEALAVGRALGLTDATLAHVVGGQERPPANVVRLAARMRIVGRIASDRGVSADVIAFTERRLQQPDEA